MEVPSIPRPGTDPAPQDPFKSNETRGGKGEAPHKPSKGEGKGESGKGSGDSATREEISFQRVCNLLKEEILKGSEGDWNKVMELTAQCPHNFAESLTLRMIVEAKLSYACVRGSYLEITGSGVVTGQSKAVADSAQVYYRYPRQVWQFFIHNAHAISAMLNQVAGTVHCSPAVIQRALVTCWYAEHEEPWKTPADEKRTDQTGIFIKASAPRDGDVATSTFYLPPDLVHHRSKLLTIRLKKCIWILARISGNSDVNRFTHVHAHIGSISLGIKGEMNRVRKVCSSFYNELLAINSVAVVSRWVTTGYVPVYDADKYDSDDAESEVERPPKRAKKSEEKKDEFFSSKDVY